MSYTNSDGLYILTDGDQGVPALTGNAEYGCKYLVREFTFADIATAIATPAVNEAYLPANSYITKATMLVNTAFVGATGTLNIGLVTVTGGTIDLDGIDAAIAVTAIDAIGDVVACNGALVAGVLGVGTADAYVSFDWDTAAFTAGAATLVIEYLTKNV